MILLGGNCKLICLLFWLAGELAVLVGLAGLVVPLVLVVLSSRQDFFQKKWFPYRTKATTHVL